MSYYHLHDAPAALDLLMSSTSGMSSEVFNNMKKDFEEASELDGCGCFLRLERLVDG